MIDIVINFLNSLSGWEMFFIYAGVVMLSFIVCGALDLDMDDIPWPLLCIFWPVILPFAAVILTLVWVYMAGVFIGKFIANNW